MSGSAIDPSAWVRPRLRTLEPYTSARTLYGHGRDLLLLDANENAHGTTVPELGDDLHRYPDPACGPLRSGLADWLEVEPDRLWIGNGSDAALDLLLRTFVGPDGPVVIARPTYGMYAIAALAHGATVRPAPLDPGFDLDVDAIRDAAADARLVVLCSPNNPTGNRMTTDRIAAVLDAFDGPVVVDEAYVEFAAGPSLVDTMSGHANLIVLRTFSKAWGLAGARVGYLVADPRVIDALDRIDLPYPLSAPAARAATIALDRAAEMEATVRRIVAERERLAGLLDDLGAQVFPSEANFLLVRVPDAPTVQRRLAEEHRIVVRDRSGLPGLDDCLRITVGRPEDDDRLLAALEAILE